MNYYRRYPGDYIRDTLGLTLAEDGAYSRMLDVYVSMEKPLPVDRERLYLMIRVVTPEDRAAVDHVLDLYWTETPDGWVQKRALQDLEEARRVIETNRENGRKGGRPKKPKKTEKKPTGSEGETDRITETKPVGSDSLTERLGSGVTQTKALHTPDSTLHTPDSIPQEPDPPKAEERARASTRKKFPDDYPEDFVVCRHVYPKRAGGDPLPTALGHWNTLVQDPDWPSHRVIAKVQAYAAYCDREGILGTSTVLQMASFLGPKRQGYADDWEVSAPRPGTQAGVEAANRSIAEQFAAGGTGRYD